MPEVLQIEQIETAQKQELPANAKNTWVLRLPAEVCQREGFAEGTMISITIKDGGILTEIIQRTPKAKESARKFIEKYGDFMKEMERVGD